MLAGDAHKPPKGYRPWCFVHGGEAAARALLPRVDWAWDCAAACPHFRTKAHGERAIDHTPGCEGCARAIRAELIREGKQARFKARGPKPVLETHTVGRR